MLYSLGYIMGGVLRGGNRDMLQPSEKTWEKKEKKNILKMFFFLFVRGRGFSTVGRELS